MQPTYDVMYRESTVGKELLKARGMFTEGHWYWICILALFGFSLIFNVLFVLALTFLTRKWRFLNPISYYNKIALSACRKCHHSFKHV